MEEQITSQKTTAIEEEEISQTSEKFQAFKKKQVNISSVSIKLASPEDILSWSYGEVTSPETINYRTQKPKQGGLFCPKIFGPEKDFECQCGKYKKIKYKGIICDKCGVEVTKSSVRRERMGHITLAAPVAHLWFLRNSPSYLSVILDIPLSKLEEVIYFVSYIVIDVDYKVQEKYLNDIEKAYLIKKQEIEEQDKEPLEKKAEIKEANKIKEQQKKEILEIKPLSVLSETILSSLLEKYKGLFEFGIGAEALIKILKKINLEEEIKKIKQNFTQTSSSIRKDKLYKRLKIFTSLSQTNSRPEWMFLSVIGVLPLGLRPMVQLDEGNYASSDLNDLYRKIINRNNRLKYLLEIKSPEVIIRNEKRMLQEAVDALIDNSKRKGQSIKASTGERRLLKSLSDTIKGKKGYFRYNFLGKRVDYSARSVIVAGPALKFHQCGLPKTMALEIFRPFVISKLLEEEIAYSLKSANYLIESKDNEVWRILEQVVKDKYVLLNRAPTLHRLGVQAFQPILIEDKAIQLHPLTCRAFNADFDGDTMAVHLPLSIEAQLEAKQRMSSLLNLLKPSTGFPIVSPTIDIVLGCYWITQIEKQTKNKKNNKKQEKILASFKDALLAYEFKQIGLRQVIKVRDKNKFITTTVGRIMFNDLLPSKFGFVNQEVDFKMLETICSELIEHFSNPTVYLDRIKNFGFYYASISGVSWGQTDLIVPKEKSKIIKETEKKVSRIEKSYSRQGFLSEKEKTANVIEFWQEAKKEIEKLIFNAMDRYNNVSIFIHSGARGSLSQLIQMAGMKGLVSNPRGEIIEFPIKNSFKQGLSINEYFISTHGARKGIADKALATPVAGYLSRKLIDATHSLVIREHDCKTKNYLVFSKEQILKHGGSFKEQIFGRVIAEDIKIGSKTIIKAGDIITNKISNIIEKNRKIQEIKVRTCLKCETLYGICQQCYGMDLVRNSIVKIGEAVGVVAAQSIGEPGTQLTMRTFHKGGAVEKQSDIIQGLPRIQELFEARTPIGKACISHVKGIVKSIQEKENYLIITVSNDEYDLIEKKKGNSFDLKNKIKSKKNQLGKEVVYSIPKNTEILVKEQDSIKKGQQISVGAIDVKELFALKGEDQTADYIIKALLEVYTSQGISINRKHLEIVVKQMFSRVYVNDAGDTDLIVKEIIEKDIVIEKNRKIEEQGGKKASYKIIISGITQVSLTTNSFLSAASFQETSRVLAKAAVMGKEDKLKGLKESIIIGKMIPVGTGFRKTTSNEQQTTNSKQ